MKLNEEQTAGVGVLVRNEVTYQETYQEVYDHVLTSLGERRTLPDLQKAYGEILEEDFGGHYGIEMLEENRKRIISNETVKKQKELLYRFFKWPGVLFSILFGCVCGYYWGMFFLNINSLFSTGSILAIVGAFIAMGVGNYMLKQKNSEVKPSINNVSLKLIWTATWKYCLYLFLLRMMCSFLYISMSFNPHSDYHHWLIIVAAIMIDIATFLFVMYLAAGLLVYKNEFKRRLAI